MKDISLSSSQTGLAIAGLIIFLIVTVLFLRWYFKKKSNSNLLAKYSGKNVLRQNTKSRNKYPEVNVLLMSDTFLKLGLVASLLIIVLAFSWTTYEKKVVIPDQFDIGLDEIEVEVPRTAEPPLPPPPPPPPVIQEVPDEVILEEDEPIFLDQDITEETIRISAGIESAKDLIGELKTALEG